jgi:hypothetical protein
MDENRFIHLDEAVFFDGRDAFFPASGFPAPRNVPGLCEKGFFTMCDGSNKKGMPYARMPFEKKLTFRF